MVFNLGDLHVQNLLTHRQTISFVHTNILSIKSRSAIKINLNRRLSLVVPAIANNSKRFSIKRLKVIEIVQNKRVGELLAQAMTPGLLHGPIWYDIAAL